MKQFQEDPVCAMIRNEENVSSSAQEGINPETGPTYQKTAKHKKIFHIEDKGEDGKSFNNKAAAAA